jgi:soluble lytic murein transglycosylase-like protein
MKERSTLHLRRTLTPLLLLAAAASVCPKAFAAEHITLRNGAEFDCIRQEPAGDRIRLYLFPSARVASPGPAASSDANYIEVSASSVVSVETVPDPPPPVATSPLVSPAAPASAVPLSPAEMNQMLARAGTLHNIDVDLLASVVKAESNGNARAVSRAGAQGLMQLMPATASSLGVHNSFVPEQNIGGGTAYLDQLLIRYDPKNDTYGLELAVAAYNAGPAAVDRYHGIPPYAETRAYVARVIREFNRRKRAAAGTLTASAH